MSRVCLEPGCPVITDQRRCPAHTRTTDRARGTREQRGYGREHTRYRKQWAPQVATGTVKCWRCRRLISGDEPWDLGHDDLDRRVYRGPEHVRCNRGARPA